MDLRPINGLSLCAGVGSLDLGVELALPGYRTVVAVEIEAFAAATLAARMEEGSLVACPIWSDLTTFDGRPWRGRVQIITAGLPCQPYSVAGKRLGHDDERAIWPEAMRIIGEVRPALVFLENVPNFLQFFRPVGEELCRLGYEFKAGLFSASEVGASHRRERLFVLAHSRREPRQGIESPVSRRGQPHRKDAEDRGDELAHSTLRGRGELREPSRRDGQSDGSDSTVADAARRNRNRSGSAGPGRWIGFTDGDSSLAHAGSERPQGHGEARTAPGAVGRSGGTEVADANSGDAEQYEGIGTRSGNQTVAGSHDGPTGSGYNVADASIGQLPDKRRGSEGRSGVGHAGEVLEDAARNGGHGSHGEDWSGRGTIEASLPLFPPGPGDAERWRAILAEHPELAPAIESEFRGVVDGLAPRLDRLRASGNGVVALTGAFAFITLARKLGLRFGGSERC